MVDNKISVQKIAKDLKDQFGADLKPSQVVEVIAKIKNVSVDDVPFASTHEPEIVEKVKSFFQFTNKNQNKPEETKKPRLKPKRSELLDNEPSANIATDSKARTKDIFINSQKQQKSDTETLKEANKPKPITAERKPQAKHSSDQPQSNVRVQVQPKQTPQQTSIKRDMVAQPVKERPKTPRPQFQNQTKQRGPNPQRQDRQVDRSRSAPISDKPSAVIARGAEATSIYRQPTRSTDSRPPHAPRTTGSDSVVRPVLKGTTSPAQKKKKKDVERSAVQPTKKIKEIVTFDENDPVRSKKRIFKSKERQDIKEAPKFVPYLKISGDMSLRVISEGTGVPVKDIISYMFKDLNIFANINYIADIDEIGLICEHFGIQYEMVHEEQAEDVLSEFITDADDTRNETRPPVITIMGHVDHGKTKLLDYIRKSNVVAGEAGGITQHIGAYQVFKNDRKITFLDTPGHEAFTAMRARGSLVTDIVVLVVAADDGVMPQTVEAIEHAKAAKVPIIVAINKIDKPSATPDRVKQQLSQYELIPEEWGGQTTMCHISALTGQGVDDLLDLILLQTDLMDLKAAPAAKPMGVIIESKVDSGIGIVVTVLVQQGTFRKDDYILAGSATGRIKRMTTERGTVLDEVMPGTPARILGFTEMPENGDIVYCFLNRRQVQQIATERVAKQRLAMQKGTSGKVSLEDFFKSYQEGKSKELNIILKADVLGSVEALVSTLEKTQVQDIKVNILRSGVGQISLTDVDLAMASNAIIIGFNTSVANSARRKADTAHVDVRLYEIIYRVVEDIEKALAGLLEPVYREIPVGRALIKQIFKTDKRSVICGGIVTEGKLTRNSKLILYRKEQELFTGLLENLKRHKDDVKEVATGYECGMMINYHDVQEDDEIAVYIVELVKPDFQSK